MLEALEERRYSHKPDVVIPHDRIGIPATVIVWHSECVMVRCIDVSAQVANYAFLDFPYLRMHLFQSSAGMIFSRCCMGYGEGSL